MLNTNDRKNKYQNFLMQMLNMHLRREPKLSRFAIEQEKDKVQTKKQGKSEPATNLLLGLGGSLKQLKPNHAIVNSSQFLDYSKPGAENFLVHHLDQLYFETVQ